MFITVTGGSGSGKSEIAEAIADALCRGQKLYAATMIAWDEESRKRIRRHREQRQGRHFRTLECPSGIKETEFPKRESLILLECISNLAANELYAGKDFQMQDPKKVTERIIQGILHFEENSEHLVVVTNEMFHNGTMTGEMQAYLDVVGRINRFLIEKSDVFIESVYGIPYFWKKDHRLRMEKGIWVCKQED